MRITREERFELQVKRYKPRWGVKFQHCCKCRDEVYKEDMWAREEPTPERRHWFYVCDTCAPDFDAAVDYFKKRVDF